MRNEAIEQLLTHKQARSLLRAMQAKHRKGATDSFFEESLGLQPATVEKVCGALVGKPWYVMCGDLEAECIRALNGALEMWGGPVDCYDSPTPAPTKTTPTTPAASASAAAPAAPRSPLPEERQARKDRPMVSGLLDYFPAALAEAAHTSKKGNDIHNPGEPLHHARGKSMDHMDCVLRHYVDYRAWRKASDNGQIVCSADLREELGNMAWRVLAFVQEQLEEMGVAPLAPAARLPEAPATSEGANETKEQEQ